MAEKLFQKVADGLIGLKAEDLENYAEFLKSSSFSVPGGRVIGVEAFSRIEEELKMSEMTTKSLIAPDWMEKLNRWLVGIMEKGAPYILRSSACSDRGGNGIYESLIFVPTGHEADVGEIWRIERQIYEGEFHQSAIEWREKEKLPVGMAIPIQQVVGKVRGNFFYPILSGVAYTSYRGKSLVTAVFGLGAGVKGEKSASFMEKTDFGEFAEKMAEQKRISLVNLKTGKWQNINIKEVFGQIPDDLFQRINEIFGKLAKLKQEGGQDFYLEWALADENSQIEVVQIAPFGDKESVPIDIDPANKILLASGSDIVNHGKKICQHIVFVTGLWNKEALQQVAYLNARLKNYLLILPQEAFSLVGKYEVTEEGVVSKELKYEHFSNAAVILEIQSEYTEEQRSQLLMVGIVVTEHTERSGKRGGTHFQQLCDRQDILFLGAEVAVMKLYKLKGGQNYGEDVMVWQVEVEAINDCTKNMGFVFITGKPKVAEYSERYIEDFTMALRDVANKLSGDLSNVFYRVHYAIRPWVNNPNGFDPFELDPEEMEPADWHKGTLIENIEIVISEGERRVNPSLWPEIKEYLLKLKNALL